MYQFLKGKVPYTFAGFLKFKKFFPVGKESLFLGGGEGRGGGVFLDFGA
jgi:hypothetical protein